MKLWIARHHKPIGLIFGIPVLLVVLLFSLWYSYLWILAGLVLLYLSAVFVRYCWAVELREGIRILQDLCDPEPLAKIIEKQLIEVKPSAYATVLLIDQALTVRARGQKAENLKSLRELNIDARPASRAVKWVYYNNLANAFMDAGELQPVSYLLEKADQLFAGVSAKIKEKGMYSQTREHTWAEYYYQIQEYEKAVMRLDSIDEVENNKRLTVNNCYLRARILLAQNKTQEAIPHLQYVIENGNKLFVVTEAQELLSVINEK